MACQLTSLMQNYTWKNKSHDRICFPDNIIIETLLHNNLQTESHTPPHSPKTPQHNFLGIIILFFFLLPQMPLIINEAAIWKDIGKLLPDGAKQEKTLIYY